MSDKVKITLPDGSEKEYDKGITPYQIAESISGRLAKEALVSRIDGVVRDLKTPINKDSKVQILTFNDDEGKHTYWHSSSHLMAHAVKELYPEAKFGVGPAIDGGFYYDIDINTQLTEEDLPKIEQKMMEIAAKDEPFEREELSKQKAIDIYSDKGDNYKLEIIDDLNEDEEVISIYKEGSFTDLCTGPHVPTAGVIKNVKLLSVSGSYWRGDEKRQRMQRIYGITFPKKKMLEEHLALLEEAKKRDHRKLGKQLDL